MRISTTLLLIFITVSLVATIAGSYAIYFNVDKQIRQIIYDELEAISYNKELAIEKFLEGQENKIELISTQSDLSNEELKELILKDNSFYDMFVIDSNGIVIRSSNPERIGLDRANRSYFFNARNQTYISPVYFALVPREYSISVSAPFRGGVLVGAMKLDHLNKIVLDREGLGKTGETLLAFLNEENQIVYFSERRFSDKKIEVLSQEEAKNRPILAAINHEEGLFTTSRDYRNVPVLASANYLERIGVGMVTKIDKAEAIDLPKYNLIKIFLIVGVIIVIFVSLIGFFVSKLLSYPIFKLKNNIDLITKGNLEVQLEKSNITEIKELTNSLNRILASMKLAILRTGVSSEELGIGDAVKAKEEAEEKYKLLFDNINDAVFIHDLEGKFLEINKVAYERLGYKKGELLKIGPSKIDSPEFAKLVPARIKELEEKGKLLFNTEHVTKGGEKIPVEISSIVIDYEGKPAILSIARDLRYRKKDISQKNGSVALDIARKRYSKTLKELNEKKKKEVK